MKTWTDEQTTRLRSEVSSGRGVMAIAAEMGVNKNLLWRKMREHGIQSLEAWWTQERTDALIRHHQDGKSCAESADLLDISRSAVSGKRKRLGLRSLPDTSVKVKSVKRLPPPKSKPIVKVVAPAINPVPFILATRHHCAWPMLALDEPGHMDMLVCGSPRFDGSVYCHHHRLKAWSGFDPKPVKASFEATVMRRAP